MTTGFPLLGEPTVVEFTNTLYVDPDGEVDFLGDIELTRGWIAAIGGQLGPDPTEITSESHTKIVELRDAVRDAFTSHSSATPPEDSTVAVLSDAANLAAPIISIDWPTGKSPSTRQLYDASTVEGFLASLAAAAIRLVSEPDEPLVLVCDRPACNMRYLQHHRRRRYCNPSCANADRQARYQRSQNRTNR